MSIPDELRKAILADGRSQRAIAEAAGVHYVSLNRFMTGHSKITSDAMAKLEKALGGAFLYHPPAKRKAK